jgi:hypothetical protein
MCIPWSWVHVTPHKSCTLRAVSILLREQWEGETRSLTRAHLPAHRMKTRAQNYVQPALIGHTCSERQVSTLPHKGRKFDGNGARQRKIHARLPVRSFSNGQFIYRFLVDLTILVITNGGWVHVIYLTTLSECQTLKGWVVNSELERYRRNRSWPTEIQSQNLTENIGT